MSNKKRVYLDNTATTCVRKEVITEMKKYFHEIYANPSSIHMDGLMARGSVELARERIANQLGCFSDEIIFTGSGSEANNLAVLGTAFNKRKKGKHIITSQIEHKSVLNTCIHLEEKGFDVSYLSVDSQGNFNLDELNKLISKQTILVSLGYVNNEIGNIQDIKKIIKIVRKYKGIILHFDGVQALPYLKLNLLELDMDMMSFSGHKLYAPKGVGILYIKKI